jgi:hypothetical protein
LTLNEIMEWHYEPPYDFYDIAADPFDHPERLKYVCEDDGRSRRSGSSRSTAT